MVLRICWKSVVLQFLSRRKSALVLANGEDVSAPSPADVQSLEGQPRTQLTLKKLAHRRLTYADFLREAAMDDEMKSYAHFIMENYGPHVKSRKTQNYTAGMDFAYFLARTKFESKLSGTQFKRNIRAS